MVFTQKPRLVAPEQIEYGVHEFHSNLFHYHLNLPPKQGLADRLQRDTDWPNRSEDMFIMLKRNNDVRRQRRDYNQTIEIRGNYRNPEQTTTSTLLHMMMNSIFEEIQGSLQGWENTCWRPQKP
jgi:hypothetical protein